MIVKDERAPPATQTTGYRATQAAHPGLRVLFSPEVRGSGLVRRGAIVHAGAAFHSGGPTPGVSFLQEPLSGSNLAHWVHEVLERTTETNVE